MFLFSCLSGPSDDIRTKPAESERLLGVKTVSFFHRCFHEHLRPHWNTVTVAERRNLFLCLPFHLANNKPFRHVQHMVKELGRLGWVLAEYSSVLSHHALCDHLSCVWLQPNHSIAFVLMYVYMCFCFCCQTVEKRISSKHVFWSRFMFLFQAKHYYTINLIIIKSSKWTQTEVNNSSIKIDYICVYNEWSRKSFEVTKSLFDNSVT